MENKTETKTIVARTYISRTVAGYEKLIVISKIVSICRNKKELQILAIDGTNFYLDFETEAEAEAVVEQTKYYLF